MSEGQRGSKYLLITSLGALGVVFGDIGTSPLYAFRESFRAAEGLAVNQESVLGILSLMFWSLTVVVSIKYLVFVMRADNHGEGGILALTALAFEGTSSDRKKRRRTILLMGLFGTALLYGDGVITPAISVISAVEGLGVLAPAFEPWIPATAAVIIVALFTIQRQGTSRVGALFAPVMIVWFSTIAVLGTVQVFRQPKVLVAINPRYAVDFIVDFPALAFLSLSAVVLVVTGSEALYADMGHFGRRPIRLAWVGLVMPALLLNYFGQGALLISTPTAISNPFFALAPGWAQIPLILLATMAAVIASQALISGAFSLTQQAIQLGFLPRMNVDHTSPREIGQVYLSSVNYLLMITCVIVVLTFQTSSSLATAYGVAVTTTMLITSMLLYTVMRFRWGWSVITAGSLTAVFVVVDFAFFAANFIKVPDGGWFPLAIGVGVLLIMVTWKTGRARLTKKMRSGELPVERFIGSIIANPQIRVPGTAVYMYSDLGATPPPLLANLRLNEVLHETILIVTVEWATQPRIPGAKRATVHELGEGFYQVLLRFGFIESPDVPRALANITTAEFGFDADDAVYVVGKETVIPHPSRSAWRLRDRLFAIMHRNATSPVRFFELPPQRVIEVGVQVRM